MIYKSYLLEQNVSQIKNKIFLFYGENQGLKNEFKKKIKERNKGKEILILYQDEIIKSPNLLINELSNQSLFDKDKIFLISQINDKFFEILGQIEDIIKSDQIFLFSDVLEKKSKLRNLFEKSKVYGISACYTDNEINIKKIIRERLISFKGVSPQLINLIVENTGLDRNKINNEIGKIESCFNNKIIDNEKIISLLNLRTNEDFTNLKDAAFSGKKDKTNKLLGDTNFDYENNIYYLNALNQRLVRLNEIENLKLAGNQIETILLNLKPPVFWKDKPLIAEQTKKWNKKKISNVFKKLHKTEIDIKSNAVVRKDIILKDLIVYICVTANAA